MGFIYKITNPSGKVYVGKTYHLAHRIAAHKCATKKGRNIILHNSIRKYGWDAHVLEVIEEVEDARLDEREMFWIAELKTYCYKHPMGMNMTLGGEGQRAPWKHKTELRQWFSDRFTGEGNPFYGKTHSEETKRVIAEKNRASNLAVGRRVPDWGAEKGWEKVRRPVAGYGSDGSLIGKYSSLTDAAKSLGIKVGNVKDSLAYGSWVNGQYLFKYLTADTPHYIEVGEIKLKTVKKPVLYFLGNLIFEYDCLEAASRDTGVPCGSISRAARDYGCNKPLRSGHTFMYKDLFENYLKTASATEVH